ncbi:type II toxin-antitoxin system RelE/ParE family toxin [Luteolibacter flavescens]|uniref:Type II toxin-antitoxin system RelE/ParE family toxin n=1 Tax=Luteolibacter flavescens TaxID=1859460 RepID=A0ABT3FU51_9BACT|nr:type II toxin-antitoxin system RelE/ParE family toxin [Luteolibacter flavescens]MCW1887113.1 type II toxin-antitoxin system RelE/ParE family toxin [Luteolibacter flavescens]
MIRSFACKETERFFEERKSRIFPFTIQSVALRKLAQLHAVTELQQLAVPPGNRLEALKGNRKGQHSIRINDQWRVCFLWMADGPYDVEIVDYH